MNRTSSFLTMVLSFFQLAFISVFLAPAIPQTLAFIYASFKAGVDFINIYALLFGLIVLCGATTTAFIYRQHISHFTKKMIYRCFWIPLFITYASGFVFTSGISETHEQAAASGNALENMSANLSDVITHIPSLFVVAVPVFCLLFVACDVLGRNKQAALNVNV